MSQGHNLALDRLRGFVDRLERIDEERRSLGEDRKEIVKEAKSDGFDPKIIAVIIQRRKMDKAERQERDALVELYESGLES